MKKILIGILLLAFTLPALAQITTFQQLLQQLKDHPQQDTFYVNRINDFLDQDDTRHSILPKQEDSLVSLSLTVSKKLDYERGIVESTLNFAFVKDDIGESEKGIYWAQQADSLAEKSSDQEFQIRALLEIGALTISTNPNEALNNLLKADTLAEKFSDKKLLAKCERNIGATYSDALANYPKAMEWSLKAVKASEEANDLVDLEGSWVSMGNAYDGLGEYETSLTYYGKAQQAADSLGIKDSKLQNAMGEDYRLSGKYPQAIVAYLKSIELNNTPYYLAVNLSNLADVYIKMKDLPNAFSYIFKALPIAKKINDLGLISWTENILARAYLEKNVTDSALYYASDGMRAAQLTRQLEFLRDNAQTLSDIYAQKKDFGKAYDYHLQYIAYRDSINSAEVSNRAALLQYNYNNEKTNAQIASLNDDKKNQHNLLIIALGVLGLIAIGSVILIGNIRQKQKANKLLQQSYSNIELLEEIGRKITSSLSVKNIIGTVYLNVNALMDANVFGIGLYNDALKRIDFPSTYEKGEMLPAYYNSIDDENRFAPVSFNSGKEIIMGNMDEDHKNYIQQVQAPHEGGQPRSLVFLPLVAKEKKLGVLTVQSFQKNAYTDYHVYMLRNIAIYTAIALDNASAYQELKSTQAQLIQSEKMASLGELTAGIAHEIQNPLNFVNNFSDVNTELIDEAYAEISKGNIDETKLILKDIKENETKINHHGKRADAIVKGMLQHSRLATGVKEPIDINALADEYLRLAYHGLRAKDKDFNAIMKTDFDDSIGKIIIIPQDIGRVLLNLYNNAFYAVNERRKLLAANYKPIVTVSTRKSVNRVFISVRDYGGGIPQNILDKIFQPFFTTKPTGQGTGLGLSLSYDIIKAYGGEIKVETKENEGSEFIIELPLK